MSVHHGLTINTILVLFLDEQIYVYPKKKKRYMGSKKSFTLQFM